MLRFQTRPDPVFTAILHEALEFSRDWITDLPAEDWPDQYPEIARCFAREQALDVIDGLLAASRDAAVYQVTDYHWLLVYECLRVCCEVHNDMAREDPAGTQPVGPYRIGPIDFDRIVDTFFWDTDFLLDAAAVAALGPEKREMLGMSDEAFGISQGLAPHPDELRIVPVDDPGWEPEEAMELGHPAPAGPLIPGYPPPSDP